MGRPRTSDSVAGKMDKLLKKEFQNIALERFMKGRDRVYSPPKVQRKMLNHQLWPKIKEDLKIADFIDDERGQITQFSTLNIFQWMIVGFIAVILFGGLIYVSGILNTTFLQIGEQNEVNAGKPGYTNLTQAAQATFGQMNQSIQALRLVALCLIVGMAFTFVLANGLVKVHPVFFFPYILIVILAVIFSASLSNAYEDLLRQNVYEGLLLSFTGSNWLLLNLPAITAVIGVLGGVLMFINIITPGNQGGLK